jgi:hypothetical protein
MEKQTNRRCLTLGLALFFILNSACGSSVLPGNEGPLVVDDDRYEVAFEIERDPTTKVDILFVIDSSCSMTEEQMILTEQVDQLVLGLISPADPSVTAIEDIHLGVVTTDMGTHGFSVQTCTNPFGGDDGLLQNTVNVERVDDGCTEGTSYNAPDCTDDSCPWFSHSREHPDDGTNPNDTPVWERNKQGRRRLSRVG